jgi:hypothetical protein
LSFSSDAVLDEQEDVFSAGDVPVSTLTDEKRLITVQAVFREGEKGAKVL